MRTRSGAHSGRVVLVTGAAGAIGSALCRRLRADGVFLALADVDGPSLQGLVAELGEGCCAFAVDLTDDAQVGAAVEGTAERWGRIDAVVCTAAVADATTVADGGVEEARRTLEINLLSAWSLVAAALPHLARTQGYLLLIGSASAFLHAPGHAAYAASKAGVVAFGDALRAEVAPLGVRVGVAHLGRVATPAAEASLSDPLLATLNRASRNRLLRPQSVEATVDALVRGLQRGARDIVAPRWLLPAVAGPILTQRMLELLLERASRGLSRGGFPPTSCRPGEARGARHSDARQRRSPADHGADPAGRPGPGVAP